MSTPERNRSSLGTCMRLRNNIDNAAALVLYWITCYDHTSLIVTRFQDSSATAARVSIRAIGFAHRLPRSHNTHAGAETTWPVDAQPKQAKPQRHTSRAASQIRAKMLRA